jgi:Fic family protein
MQELLDHIDSLKAELDSYRPISNEHMNRIMQKLHLEWNFNSNSMEGNTLTMTETRQLLYYGITAKGKPLKDHIEMRGHDQALKKLEGLIHKEFKLTESLIKAFHLMILEGSVSLQEKEVEINPGHWKKSWNYLYTPTGKQIYFADPKDVPDLMSELINWTNNQLYQEELNRHSKKKYDLHPLLVASLFHKRFIDIHPFGDGNGRMARILSNLILMQAGFMPAIVPLKTKDNYYNALNASSKEDINPLLDYIGENLIKSMELAIEGAKGNPVEEPDDWDKQIELLKRKLSEKQQIQQHHKNSRTQIVIEIIEKCLPKIIQKINSKFSPFSRLYEYLNFEISIQGRPVVSVGNITEDYISLLLEDARKAAIELSGGIDIRIDWSMERFGYDTNGKILNVKDFCKLSFYEKDFSLLYNFNTISQSFILQYDEIIDDDMLTPIDERATNLLNELNKL